MPYPSLGRASWPLGRPGRLGRLGGRLERPEGLVHLGDSRWAVGADLRHGDSPGAVERRERPGGGVLVPGHGERQESAPELDEGLPEPRVEGLGREHGGDEGLLRLVAGDDLDAGLGP